MSIIIALAFALGMALTAIFVAVKPPENAPRWWHRFYAWTNGYFWLDCVTCGEPRGGHERQGGTIWEETDPDTHVTMGTTRCKKHPEEVHPL